MPLSDYRSPLILGLTPRGLDQAHDEVACQCLALSPEQREVSIDRLSAWERIPITVLLFFFFCFCSFVRYNLYPAALAPRDFLPYITV
jgi:hypothetical protein